MVFRLRVPGGPSGYPAVRRSSGSPREKEPANGLLKQPARTGCWRLVVVHLIYEEWASARYPSLNSPVETVSPPRRMSAGRDQCSNRPAARSTRRGSRSADGLPHRLADLLVVVIDGERRQAGAGLEQESVRLLAAAEDLDGAGPVAADVHRDAIESRLVRGAVQDHGGVGVVRVDRQAGSLLAFGAVVEAQDGATVVERSHAAPLGAIAGIVDVQPDR